MKRVDLCLFVSMTAFVSAIVLYEPPSTDEWLYGVQPPYHRIDPVKVSSRHSASQRVATMNGKEAKKVLTALFMIPLAQSTSG